MNIEQLKAKLSVDNMEDLLELVEDAEKGYLEELELVESIGLCYDRELNKQIIDTLKACGVEIIYVEDEE
ncbi:hypothetical protein AJ85_12825 [Alkalihalobacillus alcalophilus ATCC 27647 = CGMCC 1.3604]|uniref:Uncharacterized protein n=1 Tax=Alkalihalobacillus alcalophilus ATCC 27647 = CGMCC 1.3604 TaxID=1218173 RepID=A0A094WQK2_ALKAL|nr:hypothetical protein [Alkalihalobacillus alcalophilus]KGA99086.1 hypothetical protein BALCAV_0200065 [Alkalihalobacillus alcalophilus ATCC 27647 = CGMCC 1.3604]MED1562542.1 hypothetical protein [Alkalihalobacillus alcalophilus]THG90119.1 hypothetical protein AJ85_12825 [Alkalihalobacillus alcalophilus ATCC 27647 = CGMCC 1.3604]